jgi:AAA15 family ATPase/GTPase
MDEHGQYAAKTLTIELEDLYLDPNNYRLIHEDAQVNVSDDHIKDKDVANRTYKLILGEKNQYIMDLVESFKANGYLPVDQIQVRELKNGGYVVVEGNRRIAALKFLFYEYGQKSIDLGRLDKNTFKQVPVVFYEDSDEIHHLTIMALKHISGNRKWGAWNQAKLLEDLVISKKIPEDEVCRRIGITKLELRRSIRALYLINQYRISDYGDQFNETMFPIFYEAARNTALKEWLDWEDTTNIVHNAINRDLFFSWLSRELVEEEDDVDLMGKIEKHREPAISKRDDIRILSKILKDENALENLKNSGNINEAYRTSSLIFKEKIDDAVKSLEFDIATLGQLIIPQEKGPALEEALGKFRGIVEKVRTGTLQGVEQNSVFFDRIDAHFSSIKIKSYRCFNDLELKTLSRINLFAGINNSGKTSLLEAIYLLCKQNDFNGIVDVLRRRGKIPAENIPSKWFADQLDETISVAGIFDNQDSQVEIRPLIEDGQAVDRTHYLKSVEITAQFERQRQESITRIYQDRGRETQADSIKLLSKVVFSSPFFFNEPYHYTMFYHKSVQSKSLPKILDFIHKKVILTVRDINLVDEFQRFLVNDDRFKQSMDLTSYGEGLQKIFFTSLLFASAENGVVLIDEFENAIHMDLIETFTSFIYELAKTFNVQVFLTSHSKECIDAFIKTVPLMAQRDFSFHGFVRNNDGIILNREFEGEKFFKLLKAGDVDLRRVQ